MRFDVELREENCKFDIYWKKTINAYSWLYWIYLRARKIFTLRARKKSCARARCAHHIFARAQTKILRARVTRARAPRARSLRARNHPSDYNIASKDFKKAVISIM